MFSGEFSRHSYLSEGSFEPIRALKYYGRSIRKLFCHSASELEEEISNVELITHELRGGTKLIITVPDNLTLKQSTDLELELSETIEAFKALEKPFIDPYIAIVGIPKL